jgi:hypothetical protein
LFGYLPRAKAFNAFYGSLKLYNFFLKKYNERNLKSEMRGAVTAEDTMAQENSTF